MTQKKQTGSCPDAAANIHALAEPVSVLMPVYNEIDVIDDVISEWAHDVFQFLPAGSELVLDDCSDDGTERRLHELASRYPFIRVNHAARDGFFNSAIRLYRMARCPLIFFTDSDGQYIPAEFWKIAREIDQHDMVHGAKIGREDPFYRIFASKVFNLLIRSWFHSRCVDVNSAFRLVRGKVVSSVLPEIHCLRMLPNSELYLRAEAKGFKIKNISVQHRPRKFSTSRSLPLRRFARECWHAYREARELRGELRDGIRT